MENQRLNFNELTDKIYKNDINELVWRDSATGFDYYEGEGGKLESPSQESIVMEDKFFDIKEEFILVYESIDSIESIHKLCVMNLVPVFN